MPGTAMGRSGHCSSKGSTLRGSLNASETAPNILQKVWNSSSCLNTQKLLSTLCKQRENQELMRQQEVGVGQRHWVPSWVPCVTPPSQSCGVFSQSFGINRVNHGHQDQIVIVLLCKVVVQDARCPWASRLFFPPHFIQHREEVKVFLKGGCLWGNLSRALPCPLLLQHHTNSRAWNPGEMNPAHG